MQKTLKDYVVKYQNGEHEALSNLIKVDNDRESGSIQLADKKLNEMLYKTKKIYSNYVDESDIEQMMLQFLVDKNEAGENIGILDKIDTTKKPAQIISYVSNSWNGFVKDKLDTLHFNDDVVTDEVSYTDGEVETKHTLYDRMAYDSWVEVGYSSSFKRFLNEIGGLENILTERQFEIMTLINTKNQNEVAELLDVSQSTVSTTLTQAYNKMKKAYISWKAIELLSSKQGKTLNETVRLFVNEINKIKKYDTTNTFNYFDYTIQFLRENSTKADFEEDIEELQINKREIGDSVIGVIIDNLRKNQFQLVGNTLEQCVNNKQESNMTQRDKDRFVLAVLKALSGHFDKTKERVTDGIELIIEQLSNRNYTFTGSQINTYQGVIRLLKKDERKVI